MHNHYSRYLPYKTSYLAMLTLILTVFCFTTYALAFTEISLNKTSRLTLQGVSKVSDQNIDLQVNFLDEHTNSLAERQVLKSKLSNLRRQLLLLFNELTADHSLHFTCKKMSDSAHVCERQITWQNKIKASKHQYVASKERDKAVLEQLNLLLKTNAEFKLLFQAFKQAEEAYLAVVKD